MQINKYLQGIYYLQSTNLNLFQSNIGRGTKGNMILRANSKCKSKKEIEKAEFKNSTKKAQKFLWARGL